MLQFEQLISNKYFVLVFIETLEAQEGFNIRDKYVIIKMNYYKINKYFVFIKQSQRCLFIDDSVDEQDGIRNRYLKMLTITFD